MAWRNPRFLQDPWKRTVRHVGWILGVYTLGAVGWCVAMGFRAPPSARLLWFVTVGGEAVWTAGLLVALRFLVRWRLWRPLYHQAVRDDLTGCYRPTAFWERCTDAVAAAYRQGRTLAFVFLDLDDFKQINDHWGHQAGDAALRAFGQLIGQHARAGDLIGRLGGEEFGWILPDATAAEALQAAYRLLSACEAAWESGAPTIAFSGGVAAITGREAEPSTVWDLVQAADRALYRAKLAGKRRVIGAE